VGVLQVIGAFVEEGQDRRRVAAAMAGELQTMAGWLGLGAVAMGEHGDLAAALRRAL
jgi:uncharacterized protein YcaQ